MRGGLLTSSAILGNNEALALTGSAAERASSFAAPGNPKSKEMARVHVGSAPALPALRGTTPSKAVQIGRMPSFDLEHE